MGFKILLLPVICFPLKYGCPSIEETEIFRNLTLSCWFTRFKIFLVSSLKIDIYTFTRCKLRLEFPIIFPQISKKSPNSTIKLKFSPLVISFHATSNAHVAILLRRQPWLQTAPGKWEGSRDVQREGRPLSGKHRDKRLTLSFWVHEESRSVLRFQRKATAEYKYIRMLISFIPHYCSFHRQLFNPLCLFSIAKPEKSRGAEGCQVNSRRLAIQDQLGQRKSCCWSVEYPPAAMSSCNEAILSSR